MRIASAASLAASTLLIGTALGAPAAVAGGSDAPTPYEVSTSGLTLPDGKSFIDGGHVNIRFTTGNDGDERSASIHFESLNNQASGKFIGESHLPWSQLIDADTYCITWVQVGQYDEHFGEGGQDAVCVDGENPAPEPSEEPSEEPTAGTSTPSDEPTGEPTTAPSGEPGTPGAEPSTPAESPAPAASDSPEPSAPAEVPDSEDSLAATGATIGAAVGLAALLAAGGAAIIFLSRRAKKS